MLQRIKYRILTYQFVFSELMKRDFKKKYKREKRHTLPFFQ